MGLFSADPPVYVTYHLKAAPPSKEEKEKKEKEEQEKKEKEEQEKKEKETVRYIALGGDTAFFRSADPSKAPIINLPTAPAPAPAPPPPPRPQVHHYFPAGYGGGSAGPYTAVQRMYGGAYPAVPAPAPAPAPPSFPTQFVPYGGAAAGEQYVRCRELDGSVTLRTPTDCVAKASPGAWVAGGDGRIMWWRLPKTD